MQENKKKYTHTTDKSKFKEEAPKQEFKDKKNRKSKLAFEEKKNTVIDKFVTEDKHTKRKPKPKKVKSHTKRVVQKIYYGKKKATSEDKEDFNTGVTEDVKSTASKSVRYISYRNRRRKQNKSIRTEKKLLNKKINTIYNETIKDNPEFKTSNPLNKYFQKKRIKKQYVKQLKKAQRESSNIIVRTFSKVGSSLFRQVKKHSKGIVIALLPFLIVIGILTAFIGTVGSMFGQGGTAIIATTYLATEEEITNAELYYTELETDLYLEAYKTESTQTGYDEYIYHIADIGHNPFELTAYLTAKYQEFVYDDVTEDLQGFFNEQYTLWTEEVTEIREREITVINQQTGQEETKIEEYEHKMLHVYVSSKQFSSIAISKLTEDQQTLYYGYMESLGNRQMFYNPFSELNWFAYVSDYFGYRVHPINGTKNKHTGIDIALSKGTPIGAIMDGTVIEAVNNHKDYGNYVVIKNSEGFKSLYAHCDTINVTKGQKVSAKQQIATVGSTGTSTGNHLHLELYYEEILLNPIYFVETGSQGFASSGDIPPPTGDSDFERLMQEATKYIGFPYVWGGSSPSTSFDCSGFVCWVYTQSGVYNLPRTTAQGIYNQCTPISAQEVKPGDLVFFTGTYSTTSPVTHIGIYIGDNKMLHCGDPIGYESLSNSYWSSHFYGFGRLN